MCSYADTRVCRHTSVYPHTHNPSRPSGIRTQITRPAEPAAPAPSSSATLRLEFRGLAQSYSLLGAVPVRYPTTQRVPWTSSASAAPRGIPTRITRAPRTRRRAHGGTRRGASRSVSQSRRTYAQRVLADLVPPPPPADLALPLSPLPAEQAPHWRSKPTPHHRRSKPTPHHQQSKPPPHRRSSAPHHHAFVSRTDAARPRVEPCLAHAASGVRRRGPRLRVPAVRLAALAGYSVRVTAGRVPVSESLQVGYPCPSHCR